VIAWIPLLVVVAFVGGFAVSAWSPRIGAARDRLALVMDGALAAGILFAGRMIVDWTTVGMLTWYALVAVLAFGAVGAVLRWHGLPSLKDPAKRPSRIWGAGLSAAFILAIVVVVGF
jgi:hypothetical protein